MKYAQDLMPWLVTDISVYPYGSDYWSMNPSIHRDSDGTWRCVNRIVDYAMPDGTTIRSKSARGGQQTKNAMIVLDPQSWKPIQIFKMHEQDALPRASSPHVGYEDMRLFQTDQGGLQGIAASLHLERSKRSLDGRPQHQPPEQVLLSFDTEYNIVGAQPIRGAFSGKPQKNWVPFDHCVEPRFLYSIDKGSMFDARGPVHGTAAVVSPSTRAITIAARAGVVEPSTESAPLLPAPPPPPAAKDRHVLAKEPKHGSRVRGGDVKIVRGGRMKLDAGSSRRPVGRSASARTAVAHGADSTRMMGSGLTLLPTYVGLRGGTQLVRVTEDAWLGIGHEMKFVNGKKYYWHVWYLVNSHGKLMATSEPMKLAPNGIEFAAGMAIDGDRVVVSFGVDDMKAVLGETKLSAVMELLKPIRR